MDLDDIQKQIDELWQRGITAEDVLIVLGDLVKLLKEQQTAN